MTACGWVPIEEVQVGDWVWARDEVTGEVRLCEVEETYRNESPVILEVTVGGETLATTPGHPFWVLDHGWKDAGELEVGDHLVNLRGESVVVEDIRRRPVPEAVYNFSVAGLHTYFVGQGGIWVHNNSGSGCGVPGGGAKKAGPIAGGGAKLENLSPQNLDRIQAIADKRGLNITVVGSRSRGTADAASDWDYIITGGTSKARHSAMRELPSNPNANKGGDFRPGSEELRGVEVDPNLPHIIFTPQPQ